MVRGVDTNSPFYKEINDSNYRRELSPLLCINAYHKSPHGSYKDPRRNMWVCPECFKPSKVNNHYTVPCLYCAEEFVLWFWNRTEEFHGVCEDCGGTNFATVEKTLNHIDDLKRLEALEK